jgi:hypothetical protein
MPLAFSLCRKKTLKLFVIIVTFFKVLGMLYSVSTLKHVMITDRQKVLMNSSQLENAFGNLPRQT